MRSKRVKEKLLALILAFAVVMAMVPGGSAFFRQDADAASTITLTGKKFEYKDEYGKWHTNTYFSGGGYEGLCAKAHYNSIIGKHTYTMHNSSNYCKSNIMAKLAYHYGYKKGWTRGTNGGKLARCLNYVSTQSGAKDKGKAFNFKEKTLKAMVNTAKNVKVPEGFVCWFVIPKGDTSRQSGVIWKYTRPGTLTVMKGSAVTGYKESFAGCEYTLYKSDKKTVVGKLICKADGTADPLTVQPGTYYAKETKSNANYVQSSTWYTVKIESGKNTALRVSDEAKGTFALQKEFSPDSDEGYTMQGFTFRLTNTANSNLQYSGVTDENGKLSIANISAGTYSVTEVLTREQQMAGYSNQGKQGTIITIGNGKLTQIQWKNSYKKDHCLRIFKTTDDGTTQAGFHFDIRGEVASRKLTTDTFMSYAHITAEKTPAAQDAESGAEEQGDFEIGRFSANEEDLAALNAAAASKKTGDYTVRATAQAVRHPEEGEEETKTVTVSVKVTLRPVSETEQITNPVTPAEIEGPAGWNISYRNITWAGSACDYHKNDEQTVSNESGEVTVEGIFPGTYTIKEELTEAQQKHFRQPLPQTRTIEDDGIPAPVIFNVENIAKKTPLLLKKSNARKGGEVAGFEFTLTGTRAFDGKTIEPVTAITNENGNIDFGELYAGDYVMEETGFDKDTYLFLNQYRLEGHDNPARAFTVTGEEKEPILIEFENDPITSFFITKVDKDTQMFLEDAEFDLYENGTKTIRFRIVRGKNGVAKAEIIWKADGARIFVEEADADDNADEENPIIVDEETHDDGDEDDPEDGTPEEDDSDGSDETGAADNGDGDAGEDENAAQYADYNYAILKGLKRGADYRIVETKAPNGYSGAIDYGFTFEEEMNPIVLENTPPEIATRAKDAGTGLHLSNATASEVTIVDTIMYKNLTPGKEYTMTGRLMFKPQTQEEQERSSEEVRQVEAGGKEVENTIRFTPEKEEGTVDIKLRLNAADLEGKKTVIFETLRDPILPEEDSVIASHSDTDNEAQSVYFPKLRTEAVGGNTGMHITEANRRTVIVDTVAYSNVIAGRVYEVRGVLMDRKTGQPVKTKDGKVTASVKFKATENGPVYEGQEQFYEEGTGDVRLVSGTVSLTFTFDAEEYAGRSLVAFEDLYTGGKLAGMHRDIKDRAQTVRLPAIGTKASAGKNVIKDKVKYRNLIPGKTYIMRGTMMDKATGKPLKVKGKTVTSVRRFVPATSHGEITLVFKADTSGLNGKSAVAFETCYLAGEEEIEIARHTNLKSKDQTVTFGTPRTGEHALGLTLIALIGSLAAACCLLIARRRKGGTV